MKPDGRRWMILAFLMALCFISHFNRASITSAGDERIMKDFGISPAEMGVVYSAFLVVYTVFMIPGGWLIDRRGARFALTCMGLGSAFFCAVTGGIGWGVVAAGSVWFALLAVRSLMGLLSVPLHPGAARAVGNWFPTGQQSLANGLITGASILAYAVVHPIFGSLIDRWSWPVAFIITGTLTALLAVMWRLCASDRPEAPRGVGTALLETQISNFKFQNASAGSASGAPVLEVPEPILSGARGRTLLFLTASYGAVGYFQYLFFYWLHFYFDSVLGMGKDESRFYTGLPNLAMAACMPIGGWLSDGIVRWRGERVGRTLVPKLGMTLSALFLLGGVVAAQSRWVPGVVACFTAALGTLGLCEASFWTVVVNLGSRRAGTRAAIMNMGGNGVGLVAPIATPWIGSHLGWGWGIGAGAAVGALGALCWCWIDPASDDGKLEPQPV